MPTRNETSEVKGQGHYTSQQTANARQTAETGSDRQQSLQTGREGRSQTGVVRSEFPAWGLGATAARNPFALMRRVMEDMDRVFEDFGLGGTFGREPGVGRDALSPFFGGGVGDLWVDVPNAASGWVPPVEVVEKGDKLVVRAEIPGVSKDDVNVEVTNDILTIQGERRQESEDRGEGFYRSERSYGRFLRSIPLPEGVDGEKAEARFKDGVLEVTLPAPKRERKRGRRVAIR